VRRLKIAVQKSGRLADRSRELLERAGLELVRGRDELVARAENLAVDVLFVRDDDIPDLVADGACDLGICGRNVFAERRLAWNGTAPAVEERLDFHFGRCRLAIALPRERPWSGAASLAGLRIATSYPRLLAAYLAARGVAAEAVNLAGAVEIAPRLGRADAICDLVTTGETLAANGLREVDSVLASTAVLLARAGEPAGEAGELARRVLERLAAVERVRESRYVMLHAPKTALAEIAALLPGSEAPTVLPLLGFDDKVAVHALCRETVFWETLERLRAAGATSVLVMPVEKMLA
jgi:ATP phosphoribosyltransferase